MIKTYYHQEIITYPELLTEKAKFSEGEVYVDEDFYVEYETAKIKFMKLEYQLRHLINHKDSA